MKRGEIDDDRKDHLNKAVDEFHLFASRMREIYDLDSVVILACKDVGTHTQEVCGRSGNQYASRHMARKYADEKFCDMVEDEE